MALNAYEGSGGDITNIQIDGLFAGLRLHPNDRGYEYFVENLIQGIKEVSGDAIVEKK